MAAQRPLRLALTWLLALSASALAAPKTTASARYYLYVGNYTDAIQAFRYDTSALSFEPLGMVGQTPRPSFLALHPNGRFLYAVSEMGNDGRTQGAVYSFSIDKATGKLNFLNKQSSGGGGACHLVVDKTGKFLLVANYGTGSIADFPLKEDGSIGPIAARIQFEGAGPNPKRQKGPHAHAVVLSHDNRFLFVPDLGTDKIRIFKFDASNGNLTPSEPAFATVKPAAGPRHFALSPDGKFAYAVDEMGSSVTAFRFDSSTGALTEIEPVSTLPGGFSGENNSAEIQIGPGGRFLYASNRGNNSIAVFAIDNKSGKLNRLEIVPTQGATPRNFTVDPTGKYLLAANQDSNSIVVFARNPKTGKLAPTGKTAASPSPVCLLFVPAP